ncbi:hypothetical protein GH714_002578 [Hevea brasiliensis]|uniref:Uncharacterized protein n=1 Tax=Hevea brasiliensis TaxID=3981 RepID=A0A6A6KX04_HEVBR|nr:hypothetical protein GH714_002578 [Hevea brasiliensis]
MVGAKDELERIKRTVFAFQGELSRAEMNPNFNVLKFRQFQTLKEDVYIADDLLDDLHTEALRRRALGGEKVSKEVRLFFSLPNRLLYGFKMFRKIKHIVARLDAFDLGRQWLSSWETYFERPVEDRDRREETISFSIETEVIGREEDRRAIIKFLLNSNYEKNLSIISIVGVRGIGKSTLAQLVYNDEQVTTHFEHKVWVSVSVAFDIKLIAEKILESITGERPKMLGMQHFEQLLREKIKGKKYLIVLDAVHFEGIEDRDSIESCKMNYSMHDLATEVAGKEGKRINSNTIGFDEKTHHVSFGFHLDSISQIPVDLFRARRLRTFLLPNQEVQLSSKGRWEMSNFEAIFSKFRRLRVFDLHNSGIMELPTSIDKLKHLRYLDVSKNDDIKALPDSITRLINLQVLKLSDCTELRDLPRDIRKLVNLSILIVRDVGN